ncbi:pirin family protein [Chitinophagaceae bacterium LB-8]|uniref:Pirin family protein n=1 Tax=Paraflavisolibacter caeni TaxID=2982496 RepID=A0A9X2XVX8_9BACT|nr:pirin family protein [Paraflavisolibacter caeni]MCU7550196.1 pirin family protein [Paraflavisolibacter caeni]
MTPSLHKSTTRGHANHGWLDSWHSFSFADYYDPARMNFGALRVLNDDVVAPGMGFGMHPHQNMEIISIPLEGELVHKDNMGTRQVIKQGDVQVMSAGIGITHSEKNMNQDSLVKFLQIWIIPNKQNVLPRYAQKSFSTDELRNKLLAIVAPMGDKESLQIYQDAWLSMGKLDQDIELIYEIKKNGNGVYAFLLEGDVTINNIVLNRRDGLGLTEVDSLNIKANVASDLLLIEVPMEW